MKKILLSLTLLAALSQSYANDTVKIVIGSDDDSDAVLRQRVTRLERAVRQLQAQVYKAEESSGPVWACKLNVFGRLYTGIDRIKFEAQKKANQACLQKEGSIFCDSPKCTQE